jgi:hypothetical protein
MFTVSGFSGLIYESIWSHYLKLFLGHAAFAQSLVLIIFMGGMAAGAWLVSRYSSNWKLPLLAYAIVEIVIGVLALLFHGVFQTMIDAFYFSILPGIGRLSDDDRCLLLLDPAWHRCTDSRLATKVVRGSPVDLSPIRVAGHDVPADERGNITSLPVDARRQPGDAVFH